MRKALKRAITPSRPSNPAGQAPIQGQSQWEKIAGLREAILAVLETTHWPQESKQSVKGLIDDIKQIPTVQSPSQNDTTHGPVDVNVEQLVSALQNVKTKLDPAASRHGSSIEFFSYFHGSEKCNQVLNACRAEITGALSTRRSIAPDNQVEGEYGFRATSVESSFLNERKAGTAPAEETQDHQTPSVPRPETTLDSENTGDRLDATFTSDQQPANPSNTAPASNEKEAVQSYQSAGNPRRKELLDLAHKALQGIEKVSGALPIVGSYVGAAAKVGVACVEIAQLADKNEGEASTLQSRTTRLSEILGQFDGRFQTEDEIRTEKKLIRELQKELQAIQEEIKVLNSSSTFRKLWSSSNHADRLKEFQEKIRVALEELQLLASLSTSDLILEMSNKQIREENDRLLNLLGDASYGARGHTIEDVICLPGTRVSILERIENWIRGGKESKPVLWVLGMAGRGKSTLASTVAHKWQTRAPCAIFHFRRGQIKLQNRLICALARQLGTCTASPVKHAILKSIRENKDIAQGRLEIQLQFLVGALKSLQHPIPIILVVDALDECDDIGYAVSFVSLIRQYAESLPPVVKILLTCRPEAQLLDYLRQAKWEEECLDLESNMDESEIRLFMEYELSRIRKNRSLPQGWPPQAAIQTLVERSQKLFQWSRTAVKYIESRSPEDRLEELLQPTPVNDGLDGLYKPILSKAFEEFKSSPAKTQLLKDVLGLLVVAPHPISIDIIVYLYSDYDSLRDRPEGGRVRYLEKEILSGLSPLLSLPNSSDHHIRLGHTSLRDLLISGQRCGEQPYFIDLEQYHCLIATKCLRLMLRYLQRNICELSDLSKPNTEVQDAVPKYVLKGLQYCCRSWSIHLCASSPEIGPQTGPVGDLLAEFERFSKEKLLGWIEVMSLIGETKQSMVIAKQTKLWLEKPSAEPRSIVLATLWNDVYRFITEFQDPLSFGALHVYATAIPFCPKKTKLWEYYGGEAGIQFLHGQPRNEWSPNLWTRSVGSGVVSLAYSPDGKTIASGCDGSTLQLWDAETGLPVGKPFEGHAQSVSAVTFSPDGSKIASSSHDGTIRLWDAHTGSGISGGLEPPLQSENPWVYSVQFSPDGKKIAGGYSDNSIRLWDVDTRQLMNTSFEGHIDEVYCVAFSPNGERIASGSADGTVRLWNTDTGLPIGEPIQGSSGVEHIVFSRDGKKIAHTSRTSVFVLDADKELALNGALENYGGSLLSIAFSPDGKKIASGSDDGEIRLWDVETRVAIGQPLKGHTHWIRSVAFSPIDGTKIVSSSFDKTIRMWDLGAGVSTEIPSDEDISQVISIAISPGGKMIATGSWRGTIGLWDTRTGLPVREPWKGHEESVRCLDYSPDGRRLASCSFGEKVRLWDVETGYLVGELLVDPGDVIQTVAWSPHGGILASGAENGTVCLWDADRRLPIGALLIAHNELVACLAFSPDGKKVASASHQKICLWDAQTQSYVRELPLDGVSKPVLVAFSSDGSTLLVEFTNGGFCTWNLSAMQSPVSPSSYIDFPEPFVYLRLREQWLFWKDSRTFWLPSEYMVPSGLPFVVREGVLFCLGRTCCTLDISQSLRYLPKPLEKLGSFKVVSVKSCENTL